MRHGPWRARVCDDCGNSWFPTQEWSEGGTVPACGECRGSNTREIEVVPDDTAELRGALKALELAATVSRKVVVGNSTTTVEFRNRIRSARDRLTSLIASRETP